MDKEKDILNKIITTALFGIASYVLLNYLGSTFFKKRSTLEKIKQHPNIEKISKMDFNSYELSILDTIVLPQQNNVTFDDIGGLKEIIDDLKDTIFFPLEAQKHFTNNKTGDHNLFSVPKGILFYGPPGTGKTMMAKAIANYAGYNFFSIDHSIIDHKWYGETEKNVAAIFSVAKKLQPSIIFFDEVDSMTGTRMSEHEATTSKKSMLLQLWDGFNSSSDQIIIIGATNRIEAIDQAFLRRFERRFLVRLPDDDQRKQILQIILKDYVDENFEYSTIASLTSGFSGSDLKDLCKSAFNTILKEQISNKSGTEIKIKLSDFKKPLAAKIQQKLLHQQAQRQFKVNNNLD